ncbi:MAG: hypothetical protein FWG75_03895 [Cystobacterineae bacterium]|nr:hypothetical protein [Cystobacterineae bacterium]
MRKQKALSWVLLLACFGCAVKRGADPHAVVEVEEKAQPNAEAPSSTVPSIQISLVGESLDARNRTQNPAPKIQVDVHGAEFEAEFQLVEHKGEQLPLSCVAIETGLAKKQHQRWECVPTALAEGNYRLRVEAHGKHGKAIKKFSWSYDTTPLDVSIRIEDKEVWGRDDALYVQLEQLDWGNKYAHEAIDLDQSELFAGEGRQHRAAHAACPRSLPAKPHSQCFKVSLSALPDLPHGPYQLSLTATLADETGNRRSRTQSFEVRISRELWSLAWGPGRAIGSLAARPAVTREGLLLMVTNRMNEWGLKFFIIAINAKGEEVWRTKESGIGEQLMLGNHRGMDVVVANCANRRDGFWVFDAKTGEALLKTCSKLGANFSNLALLRGGPGKDLVVVRGRRLEDTRNADDKDDSNVDNNSDDKDSGDDEDNNEDTYIIRDTYALEACRFSNRLNTWSVDCRPSEPLQQTGSYFAGKILVRQMPEGVVRVFLDSLERYWCALEWKNGGWSRGCVDEGPVAVPALEQPNRLQVQVLDSERLWVKYEGKCTPLSQRFEQNTRSTSDAKKLLLSGTEPVLVDAGGELIGLTKSMCEVDEKKLQYVLRRYSVAGNLLFTKKMHASNEGNSDYARNSNIGLMEGSTLLLPSKGRGVLCLKADLSDCWAGMNADVDASGSLLGVLPLSPTRSVAVFGYKEGLRNLIAGFLIDAPGLKKDAPWPIFGHDLCRSFNASVPVDNCWDGPRL